MEVSPIKLDPIRKDEIRTVKNLLEKPQQSYRKVGKDAAIKICMELYDVKELKKLPKEDQYALIKKHYPRVQIVGQFKLWIIDFLNSVNAKNKLQPHQIDFIAEELHRNHSWTPEDLYLFFRQAKSGFYGQFYETLSPEKVIQWSEVYWSDRCSVAHTMSISNDKEKHFNLSRDKMDPKVFEAMFKGVGEDKKEQPEILRKKESTFLNSDKGFRAYLRANCAEMDKDQLVTIISRYRRDMNLILYLDIFNDRLKELDPENEYSKLVDRLVEIKPEVHQPNVAKEFDEITMKMLNLEPSEESKQ